MMKKLIIFLAILFPFMLNGQDIELSKNQYKYSYTGEATDLVDGAISLSKVFAVNKSDMYFVSTSIDVDTSDLVACSGDVTITLAGSYNNADYTTLGTVVTWGTTVDTIVNINNKTFTETVTSTVAQHIETTAAHEQIARGTITTGAYYIISESDSILISDSLLVADQVATRTDTMAIGAQTNTIAAQTITSTVTKTQPGCDYDYIRLTLLGGAAGVHVELQAIEIKITKVP